MEFMATLEKEDGKWTNRKPANHQAISWPNLATCDPETAVAFLNYFAANKDEKTGRLSDKAYRFEEGMMPANFPPTQELFSSNFVASAVKKGERKYEFLVDLEPPHPVSKTPAAAAPSNNKFKAKASTKPRIPKRRKKSKIVYAKTGIPGDRLKAQRDEATKKAVEVNDRKVAMKFHMQYLDEININVNVKRSSTTVVPPVTTSMTTIKIEKVDQPKAGNIE